MKKIYLATHNQGKVREFEALLNPNACLAGPKEWLAPEETGATYQKNAEIKARSLFSQVQSPVLSDDSGLEIDALGGQPGIHSARYGGDDIPWPSRWDFVQKKMLASGNEARTARFRCVLCYFDGTTCHFFEGVTEGSILKEPSGTAGFGYDPIFYSTELQKGFAEASAIEKDLVSHRGRAVRAFLSWLACNPA